MSARLAAQQARSALLECQRRVLEHITTGTPLQEILATLVALVEDQIPGRCALLLADAAQTRLHFVAAPHIPDDFKHDIDPWLVIGPANGSCGTAAFCRKPVYTRDTATDPLWRNCGHIAVRHGLRAIWSTPILGDDNRLLGTFAMYYGAPRLPDREHVELIEMATQMARVAIETRRAEEALRESEERYRLIAENSRDLIALVDPAGRRMYVSPSYRTVFGDASSRLEGQSAFDSVHAEDRTRIEEEFKEMIRSGVGRRFEFRVMSEPRGLRHLQIEATPILDRSGRVASVLGVGRDVTEDRWTQELLRDRTDLLHTLVENTPAGIAVADLEHKFLRVNPALCRLTGYSESELVGQPISFLTHAEDLEQHEALFRRLIPDSSVSEPVNPVSIDKRYRRRDGAIIWVHVTVSLVRGPEGEPRYTVALIDDITKRLETQHALERSARELQALSRRLVELQESERRALARELHDRDLEITESLIMQDVQANIEKLKSVRQLGVRIAIDDFGTGYSSLGYLTKLPVHALKIDRSFISKLNEEQDANTLVSTIIALAHALRLKVIAEGVETEEQADVLRSLACDEMQGYLFGKPLPAADFVKLLAA